MRYPLVLALSVLALAAAGCVEEVDPASQLAERASAQTSGHHPVSVVLRGVVPEAPESYSADGIDFTIELNSVHLVAGNVSVLAKGDAAPVYNPQSPFAPLTLAAHADDGYTAANLVSPEGVRVGEVEVPVGWAGPAYLSLTNADRTVRPDNLSEVPDISDHMLVVDATLRRPPDFERRIEALIPGEQLLVLGAPGFRVNGSVELTVEIDLRRWFEGVDPNLLVITQNTIFLSSTENAAAYEKVVAAATAALEQATVKVE